MFEDREFASRYFVGEEGKENWESFIANSRPAHDEAIAARQETEMEHEQEIAAFHRPVTFEEVSAREHEASEAEAPAAPKAEDTVKAAEPAAAPASAETSVSAMMGALTGMFGNMSEAFRRMGRADAADPAEERLFSEDADEPWEEAPAYSERDAELREKDAEIERLKKRLEQLENAAAQEPEADETADAWQSIYDDAESSFAKAEEPDDDETDEDSGIGSIFDMLFADSEPTEDVSVPAEAEPETEESEETSNSEGEFDILAFLEGSTKQAEAQETVFDRMRREGKTSAPMTLSDLNRYLESITAS